MPTAALPTAPMPPTVTQAPLEPPPAAARPVQPALPPIAVAPSPRPTTPGPAQPLAGQRYGAQLGAFRTLANASGAWDRFKARYIDLLNTVPGPLLREVDLGPKGKFVRVMAGPFGSEQEARSLCIEVLARGGFCYVQPLR
jgi:cell division septation protein DedD